MTRRSLIAIGLAALGLAIHAATFGLILVPVRTGVESPYPSPLILLPLGAFFVLTPVLGALVAIRRPDNPAGWLFLAMAILFGFGFFADSLARHLPPSPQVGLFISIASDVGSFWTVALTLLTSLFPDGRLPSRRWWIVPALPIVATFAQVTAGLIAPDGGISPPIAGVIYPLAQPELQSLIDALDAVAALFTAVGLVGFVSLIAYRFRQSRGVERQQLKWFAWAMLLIVGVLLTVFVANTVSADLANAAWGVFQGSLVLLPVSVAAAILRYRLFDIDVIIRRTLVWGCLTGVLVVCYAGAVVMLSELLSPITHGSSLAVAASTLLVAALFTPISRAVQAAVDRRFYRARYDARRELESFRARLRGEVDADRLALEVAGTAVRTMQPDSVSVWLRHSHGATVTLPERATRNIHP